MHRNTWARTRSGRHGQDTFYIWINPIINYTQEQSPGLPINISLGTAGGADMMVVPFTADELAHRETIPDYKLQYLHNFTDNDFAQILSADPWVASPSYQLDASRFIKITSFQLDGPDNPGDNLPGEGASVDDSEVVCVTNTISQTIGADFGGAVGVDFFWAGRESHYGLLRILEKHQQRGQLQWIKSNGDGRS